MGSALRFSEMAATGCKRQLTNFELKDNGDGVFFPHFEELKSSIPDKLMNNG